MKQFLAFVVTLALMAVSAVALPSAKHGPLSEKSQISELQKIWQTAYAEGDEQELQRLVSDQFVVTNTIGDVLNRTNAVSYYGLQRERVQLLFEDQRVILYGNAAVATSKMREIRSGGREILLRATDTFVKQGGRWRVAASHWTRLPPAVVEAELGEVARDRFTGEYRGPQGGLLTVTRRGSRFVVVSPQSGQTEFVAVSNTTLVDPSSQTRWLFIGKDVGPFEFVAVQNANGLITLSRAKG